MDAPVRSGSILLPVKSVEWRTRNIGRLLLCAADAFVTDKLREVDGSEFGPVTQVHIALIQNLDLGGTRLTLIAARAQMTKQSMLELVDKAEALGFVERRPDPDDRRAKIVAFTPGGLWMMKQLQDGIAGAERHMASVTGAAFLGRMKKKLAGYTNLSGTANGLAMVHETPPWRKGNSGRVMGSAFRTFSNDVMQTLRSKGFPAIDEVHMTLFRNLDLDGTRPTEIAARARMTKQAMADLIAKTELLGLVERVPDPEDGRAKTVVFTRSGLRLFEQTRLGVDAAERRLASLVGESFLAEMKRRLASYIASAETLAYMASDVRELALRDGPRGDAQNRTPAARVNAPKLDAGPSPRSSRMLRAG